MEYENCIKREVTFRKKALWDNNVEVGLYDIIRRQITLLAVVAHVCW
jgi:hypothetical protein